MAISCQSVICYRCEYSQQCETYKFSLEEIGKLLKQESNYHQFNIQGEGGYTYFAQTQYILRALNDKIANSYRQSYNGAGCNQLENEILAKSKEFGIEKIGLENNLMRLRKVLNYQDERNRFNVDLLEESNNKTQSCVQRKNELENAIKSLNSKHNEQSQKIKQQDEKIKSLEKETRRLQAKLNANAPAIHGETGKIYPEVNNTIPTIAVNGPTITSTTEKTVSPTTEEGETSPIPDIDLRNSE